MVNRVAQCADALADFIIVAGLQHDFVQALLDGLLLLEPLENDIQTPMTISNMLIFSCGRFRMCSSMVPDVDRL